MPYPNEHACRLRQPSEFNADSFRRIQEGKLSIIVGRLKGQDSTTAQAYRYPIDNWGEDEARAHCQDAGGQFEAAAPQKAHGQGNDLFAFSIPITKVDHKRREVWGVAAEERRDKLGEIMDFAASLPHFEAWSEAQAQASQGKSLGNVRAMHGSVAAGKLIHFEPRPSNKTIFVGAKVVDDDEWHKVAEGVYTAFSVGGRYGRRWPDPQEPQFIRYEAKPSEISLVDNPAMYGTTFEVVKADGQVAQGVFVGGASDKEGPHVLKGVEPMAEKDVLTINLGDAQAALKAEGGAFAKLQKLAGALGLELGEDLVKALQSQEPAPQADDGDPDDGQPGAVTAEGLTKALEPYATSEALTGVTAQVAEIEAQLGKLAPSEALTKLEGQVGDLLAQVEELVKGMEAFAQTEALGKLEGSVTALDERVVALEAQPQTGGPLMRTVGSGGPIGPVQMVTALDQLIDEETNPVLKEAMGKRRALLMLKTQHGQPMEPQPQADE